MLYQHDAWYMVLHAVNAILFYDLDSQLFTSIVILVFFICYLEILLCHVHVYPDLRFQMTLMLTINFRTGSIS